MEGYFLWSGALKVKLLALVKSRRGHVTSEHCTRSGHDMVYRIGSLMSGQPSCTAPQHLSISHLSRHFVIFNRD